MGNKAGRSRQSRLTRESGFFSNLFSQKNPKGEEKSEDLTGTKETENNYGNGENSGGQFKPRFRFIKILLFNFKIKILVINFKMEQIKKKQHILSIYLNL